MAAGGLPFFLWRLATGEVSFAPEYLPSGRGSVAQRAAGVGNFSFAAIQKRRGKFPTEAARPGDSQACDEERVRVDGLPGLAAG